MKKKRNLQTVLSGRDGIGSCSDDCTCLFLGTGLPKRFPSRLALRLTNVQTV